jgi:iron complex outermembrane receptor protein
VGSRAHAVWHLGVPLDPLKVGQAQCFTNAIDTSTNGFDLVAEHTTRWPGAPLVLSGQLGFNKTDVKARRSQSPVLTGVQLFDDAQVTLIERGQPRQHRVVAADYTRGPWNLNTRASYFGEVQGQASRRRSSRPGKRSGGST